jgi:Domain of unknown function (DUF4360)
MKKTTMFLTILSVMLVGVAPSQDIKTYPIQLGQPIYGGTGCPSHSAELKFDGKKISIHFSNFKTHLKGALQKIERKNCALRLPINIDPGYQLMITDLNVEGVVVDNNKFSVRTDVSAGFIGDLSVDASHFKAVSQKGLIQINKNLIDQDAVFTKCGQKNLMLALSTASVGVMPKISSKAQLKSEIKSAGIRLTSLKCT